MREILFRGKSTSRAKWYYGQLVEQGYLADESHVMGKDSCISVVGNHVSALTETLGQFTGLLDKNGKRIFEGDFLKSRINSELYLIKWRDCAFVIEDCFGNVIRPTQDAITHFASEIVGNIHDNPELIESEDK